jgi:hypothetical protein
MSDAIESLIRNAIHTAFIKYPDPEGGPQLFLNGSGPRKASISPRPSCWIWKLTGIRS